MSNIKLLGFPDHTAQPYAVPEALGSIEPADMTSVWLKTEEPADKARITTLDPYYSQWGFSTSLIPITIDGLAAPGHNLEDGGQYRFCAWGGAIAGTRNFPSVVLPATVVASTNMTGSVGLVSEGVAPSDGLSMVPTSTASAWSVTLRFAAPTGTINTGDGMMCLVVRARRVFSGAGSPSTLPTVTASLAAPSFPLGYRAVTVSAADGQLLIFPFKRADFTSLADLQVTLDFAPGLLNAGGHQYVALESETVYYEKTTANTPTYDSGWMTFDSTADTTGPLPTKNLHFFPAAPWVNVIGYCLQLRSDQSVHAPLKSSGGIVPALAVPSDPVDFLEAGVFPAGEVLTIERGIRARVGPMAGPESEGSGASTVGGQVYGAEAFGYRSTEAIELMVSRDEKIALQKAAFSRGRSGAFYLALEPGVSMEHQTFTAFWATIASISKPRPLGRYRADGQMLWSIEVAFQEKL